MFKRLFTAFCLCSLFISTAFEFNTRADSDPPPTSTPPKEAPKKTSWTARVIRRGEGRNSISDLSLPTTDIPVILMPKDGKLRPLVEIRGKFDRANWKLALQTPSGAKVINLKNQEFSVYAYLNSRLSDVTFLALGPNKEVETEQIILSSPEAREFRIGTYWGEILVSIGGASFNYYETGYGPFISKSGLFELTYQAPKFGRWSALAEFQLPVWTVSSAPINTGPELMNARAVISYTAIPASIRNWNLNALLGVNYLTLLANGSPFGFSNLISPEIGVRSQYFLPGDNYVLGEIHYMPIGSWISTQCGYDLTLGLSHTFQNAHRVELDLGYSSTDYFPLSGIEIQTNLLSLRLGYTI